MTHAFEFATDAPDADAFRALMVDYFNEMFPQLEPLGGPPLDAETSADEAVEHIDEILPPKERLLLVTDDADTLVGCGALRQIRPDAFEMKKMFVRPKAQGRGLGRLLFEKRIEEVRRLGASALYADTIKGNRAMLNLYEKFGFRYIDRYPENANPPEYSDFLVYLEYRFA